MRERRAFRYREGNMFQNGDKVVCIKNFGSVEVGSIYFVRGYKQALFSEGLLVKLAPESEPEIHTFNAPEDHLKLVEGGKVMFDEDKLVSNRWIVGSIDKATERLSVSATPKVHGNRAAALAEAKRLAAKETSKKFVALKLDGIARVADIVVE